MRTALMQPYFFPYIGYLQLMAAVDLFIIFDDVQYIKNGWVNRNRILMRGMPEWLTRPVVAGPHEHPINKRRFVCAPDEHAKARRRLQAAYAKAPCFDRTVEMFDQLMAHPDPNVAGFNTHLLRELAKCLGLRTRIVLASEVRRKGDLAGEAQVIHTCKAVGATCYVNASGGRGLYHASHFASEGLQLLFHEPVAKPYDQGIQEFIPWLSILDVMMFVASSDLNAMCMEGHLVPG